MHYLDLGDAFLDIYIYQNLISEGQGYRVVSSDIEVVIEMPVDLTWFFSTTW